MQAVFTDVANALNAVAAAEDDNSAQLSSPAGAPQRFAAAVQAALASDVQPVSGYAAEFCLKLYSLSSWDIVCYRDSAKACMVLKGAIISSFMPCLPRSSSSL